MFSAKRPLYAKGFGQGLFYGWGVAGGEFRVRGGVRARGGVRGRVGMEVGMRLCIWQKKQVHNENSVF